MTSVDVFSAGDARLFERLRDWEDVLTMIVDPDSSQLANATRTRHVLDALLHHAGIGAADFWAQSPAQRSRSFLQQYSRLSRGVPRLEISSFDLDRAAKERFRHEPLTIGSAWHHGYWRSYFSHAAITHPANDGLREEFSTAWDILRRRPALLFHEPAGTRSAELRSERLDLPILVGPLPHSDGHTMERAYLEAIRRSDPQQDLRTSTRVIIDAAHFVQHRDVVLPHLDHVLVRIPARQMLPEQADCGEGHWSLVEELSFASRMLELAVSEDTDPAALHATLAILHERHPDLLVSVFVRYSAAFWEQLYAAAHAPGVAMLHVHAGLQKSYRLVPAVDALLKEARLRSRVALVSAGGETDTLSSASMVYEAVLLGANGGSVTHLAELALSPRFADVYDGDDASAVLRDIAARPAEENADLASSTLSCWQHSILDLLSCMGIDDIQKTSGNTMAITVTQDWLRDVDALATREFGRRNRDVNLERLAHEPIPSAARAALCVSRLLGQVQSDLELVASARVLAQRNANYHLMNTNQNMTAEHLKVIYRMAGGRFPEVDDFFVEGTMGELSLDGIGVRVSRRSIEASLDNLRRNANALDYINLCVPRGLERPGAVPPGSRCVLSSDPSGMPVLADWEADARGGFTVRIPDLGDAASLYIVATSPAADADADATRITVSAVPAAATTPGRAERPAADAPAGLSVRFASADHRIVVREEPAGGFVVEGTGVREPIHAGPVHHASISLGAASEDFLLARVEGNAGLSLTSSGEGGPLRLPPELMRWESLQAASAHFGITAADLRAVRDVEIKINQGAKPGKGGRLAAPKVTPTVSRARNIPVGTDALSPDPKHDIYSIEDMPAEVWMWLHFDTYCGIKITGSSYTKYVAAGMWSNFVVDYLLVDAGLGGSGNYHADSSRVGWPDIFRTILHTHDALLREPLYDEATGRTTSIRDGNGRALGATGGTKLLASGGMRSEMDMLRVLIAGADGLLEASIGKAVAFGCNQCGNCHLDCPRGGITTKAELTMQNDRATMRQRFRNWSLLNMVKLAVLIDAINREHGWVDAAGHVVDTREVLDDIRKLRGRTDLLEMPQHARFEPALEVPELHELETSLAPLQAAGAHTPDNGARPRPPAIRPKRSADTVGSPEAEHDSCRVGSLVVNEPVDVDAIWEAARISNNGGNNRGGGIAFAGFAPRPLRRRTCMIFNTIGPDRAETMAAILEHLRGLRVFDAQGRELDWDEVRLRLPEFRVPVRDAFADEDGWRRVGLRESVGDVTLLFTELRGDVLWRYARRLVDSPDWLQRQVKYPSCSDEELLGAVERAVRRDELFEFEDEPPLLQAFVQDVKEEYYMALAHVIDTRYYRTGSDPRFADKRRGYVVSMGEDLGCIKISGWTHLIPAYFDFERFWAAYPGAHERGGIRRTVHGEKSWTSALLAHVWGMHHRYPTNSPAIDEEGRGNPAGAHPFKAYNVLLMHNGEQVGVDSTAALLTEHGRTHADESMGPGAVEHDGDSLYERKALTDTEYAAYLVDFTRRVLGLRTEDATQVISPITGIDLEAVTPPERRERYRALATNYVHLTPTGPYKFTIVETRHDAGAMHVGFRENMDIKFLRPHEIALNWDTGPHGVRAVANGSEAKIADAMLTVLRQKGILSDAGTDMRFNMRPGGRPGSGEMGGVFEAFLERDARAVGLSNRFGEPVDVTRAGSKPEALRALRTAVTGGRMQQLDEARERLHQLAEQPDDANAREACVAWMLERVGGWNFDEYRTIVELELVRLGRHSDAHRDCALSVLTELRKRLHLAETGGKSLAALEYFADGGYEYDGEPEGGIFRLLDAVPGLWTARSRGERTRWARLEFATRLDLAPPEDAQQVLVVDLHGFRSESFESDGAARFMSRAVHLGWRHLITYNSHGGPRYLGTNLADARGQSAEGVRIDMYGRAVGDFLGALLEGADIHCYGQGQSHVGMKADRGSLFVLQDILNTGLYSAHGGTLSVWDSGSRFAVAGQNRVYLADGTSLAQGLKSIHFGSPNEYAFEYLMSGGPNSLHVVLGLDKPDARGQLRLRPRPYAGKFFMSGAAAGRVFVFDPGRRMEPAQFHGNEAQPPTHGEWCDEVGPFIAAEARRRGLPLEVTPDGVRLRLEGEWRDFAYADAFTKYVPIRISRSAQRQGEAPPALIGMVDEL